MSLDWTTPAASHPGQSPQPSARSLPVLTRSDRSVRGSGSSICPAANARANLEWRHRVPQNHSSDREPIERSSARPYVYLILLPTSSLATPNWSIILDQIEHCSPVTN